MKIQTLLKNLGEYCCLATGYFRVAILNDHPEYSDDNIDEIISGLLVKSYHNKMFDSNFDIIDADKLLNIYNKNKKYTVTKPSFDEIKENEFFIGSYTNNGFRHWVVMTKKDNKPVLVYNSLDNSVCVNKGVFDTSSVRRVKIEENNG